MTNRSEELIHLSIDGVASLDERAELQRLMSESPEVRSRFDAMTMLVQELESPDGIDAPAGFRDEVLTAIRQRNQAAATILTPHFAGRQRRQRYVMLGYAAAAVVVIAVAVQPFIGDRRSGPVRPSDASGSMAAAGWREVGQAGGANASIVVDRRGDAFRVRASFSHDDGATRIVSWDQTKLRFTGSSAPAAALAVRPGAVTIVPNSGVQTAVIMLRSQENARGAAEVTALSLPDKQLVRTSFVID